MAGQELEQDGFRAEVREEIRDIRGELKLMRAAINNHTDRLGSVESKIDILVESVAEVRRILLSRGE